MITILFIIISLSISGYIFSQIRPNLSKEPDSTKISVILFILIPVINLAILLTSIVLNSISYLKEKKVIMEEKKIEKIKNDEIIKEKKIKIKLGIIKISSEDPYGEENWNE